MINLQFLACLLTNLVLLARRHTPRWRHASLAALIVIGGGLMALNVDTIEHAAEIPLTYNLGFAAIFLGTFLTLPNLAWTWYRSKTATPQTQVPCIAADQDANNA